MFVCASFVSEYLVDARDEEDECCHALVTQDVSFEVARTSGIGDGVHMRCQRGHAAKNDSGQVIALETPRTTDLYRVGSTFWYNRNRLLGRHFAVHF